MAKRSKQPAKPPAAEPEPDLRTDVVRRHLHFGWWALAVFATTGIVLEAAHGTKLGWYLDLDNSTRRLSFTLGHAHGTLLALINIAFAVSLQHAKMSERSIARASFALRLATVMMPLGFFLGGVWFWSGDPGLAIVLEPPSAVVLVVGCVVAARGFGKEK
jgi:hypothetical protein